MTLSIPCPLCGAKITGDGPFAIGRCPKKTHPERTGAVYYVFVPQLPVRSDHGAGSQRAASIEDMVEGMKRNSPRRRTLERKR